MESVCPAIKNEGDLVDMEKAKLFFVTDNLNNLQPKVFHELAK